MEKIQERVFIGYPEKESCNASWMSFRQGISKKKFEIFSSNKTPESKRKGSCLMHEEMKFCKALRLDEKALTGKKAQEGRRKEYCVRLEERKLS